MCVITYILATDILYIDNIQERMTQRIPNDLAATQSVTEDTVSWAPNDAYEQALGKPEYEVRVRQVGPNALPVRGTSYSYCTPSQARPSRCTSQSCSVHEDRIAMMEILLLVQTDRNEALEQRMRQFKSILASMGALHTSPVSEQSPAPNGGSTSSVCSASAGMITIVSTLYLLNTMDLICI